MATATTGLIARPRLTQTLSDAFDSGSVLLVAGPGYGKTMALEEALAASGRRSLWIGCGDVGREAVRLLMSVVEGLRTTVPGLADVVGDRLAAGLEPVDVRSASAALLPELERLLSEPLAIVFDDAEELEGADEALALLDQILALRAAPLSIAIATRRPLRLRLAKLRAAGRLAEIGPAELSFTAGECEELLNLRHGRAVSEHEVEAVIATSEGWPMGVALSGLTGPADAMPREGLFDYLAEEVLDRLDPAMRLALVDSSVPYALTPQLVTDLGLPASFLEDAERSGLFLRARASGAHTYHPLFRSFLRERLNQLRTDDERAALHVRAAESLAASGRPAESIEHWFEAGRPEQALAALSSYGAGLVITSPGTVGSWLEALPEELRSEPDYLLLDGQLLWGVGRHEHAIKPLRAAVEGYRAAGNADREWLAKVFLSDAFVYTGRFDDVPAQAEGWDEADEGIAAMAAMAVAWYEVLSLTALGRYEEADTLRERLLLDPDLAAQFTFVDVTARSGRMLAAGPTEDAVELLDRAIAELEVFDPYGRLPYAQGMLLATLRGLGEREAALEWVDRCERESARVGLGFAVDDFALQRASLFAQNGELARAEMQLARVGEREGTGWRGVYDAEAQAHVALLRGDSAEAVAAAQRALDCMPPSPWLTIATVEMSGVLADAGAPALARSAIERALALIDERFPGERGGHDRAWVLAARACLEYRTGEPDLARLSMRTAWNEAGSEVGKMVRAQWPAIKAVLWDALADGTVTPDEVLPALQDAFPGGDALVAMIEHPHPAVRREALLSALSAAHPAVLAQLAELEKDKDEQVAAAAGATRENLRSRPPSLRFELLGGFRVRRAGWELDEAGWQRPMASRVVRFLLMQPEGGVPEDVLFDAFWSDRDADSARQHLAQAVSRARKVLDLPGAEQSVIEARERTYRLRLRERDSVDADLFVSAAGAALADHSRGRRAALEVAAALWTGEPLPEDLYAPWSFAWRERLVQTYSHVLSALVEAHDASGDNHDAIRAASRLLELDPLNERAHSQLMLAYARTGQKSQALRQFLECRKALVTDLGVEPSAETSGLQARILAGDPV